MELNPETETLEFQELPEFIESSAGVRAKTPLRFKYEAQVEVLKKEMGDLEDVRRRLQMTRRQIAQLLLVDPSAWTRWVQTGGAPPHIYQALSWYLKLQENPEKELAPLARPYESARSGSGAELEERLLEIKTAVENLPQPDPNREIGYMYQVQRELQTQAKSIDLYWIRSRRWLIAFAISQILFLGVLILGSK